MNEHEPQLPSKFVPASMERTAMRFESRIIEGLTAASTDGREIDLMTARMIAHALGRALGRASALANFGRTGKGTYEVLRDEYLGLYVNATTPPKIKEWINWLGTFLVREQTANSGRQFMNEHLPPRLDAVLVRTTVTVDEEDFVVNVPASLDRSAIEKIVLSLAGLDLANGPAFQSFVSLPDVDASSENLMESFQESFMGSYPDMTTALRSLSPLEDWEADLTVWTLDQGINPACLRWNLEPLVEQLRGSYDLVESKGEIHAFAK
jgi:hypothetical protein